MKFYYWIGLIYFLLLSCNNHRPKVDKVTIKVDSSTTLTPKAVKKDSAIELTAMDEKVMGLIDKLPEVNEEEKLVDSLSHHTRHISILLYEKPDTSSPYYWVKAGEDNGENFVSYFNFFVDPKNFEIKIMNPESGDNISLKEWRRSRKKTHSLF